MRYRHLIIAVVLGLIAFLAYRTTAAPGLLPGDAGEFQFSVPNLGIAHPTGYPLYHITGWVWAQFYRQNPAQGVNLLSAFWGGVAIAFVYLLAVEILRRLLDHLRWTRGVTLLAILTALVFAANPTFWSQATQAEVYTLNAAIIAAALWLTLLASEPRADRALGAPLAVLAVVAGLGLTHHLTFALLLPGILFYLWLMRPRVFSLRYLIRLLPLFLAPLLLYLYVPLRASASPWLTLHLAPSQSEALFDDSLWGQLRFILGVGFTPALRGPAAAFNQIPFAAQLFVRNFTSVGLILAALGIASLIFEDQRPLLIFTGLSFLLPTAFNLFYGIEDIAAYYLPGYLIATIWLGLGLAYTVELLTRLTGTRLRTYLLILAIAVLALPYELFQTHRAELDRSQNQAAAQRWQEIAAQTLPTDAILVSNDRDELTPMLYKQHVEHALPTDMTALFPLIDTDAAWANLNTTLTSALATGRPVYAIKPMPGLETRYEMEPESAGLARVLAAQPAPDPSFEIPYGDFLRWLNIEWAGDVEPGGRLQVALFWRAAQTPPANWHSFLHLLDADGNKVAQADDHRPGGDYLPATLWQPGDVIRDEFALPLPAGLSPGPYQLVTGFYDPATNERLAEPLPVATVQVY